MTLSTATVGLTASTLGVAPTRCTLGGGKDRGHAKRGDDYINSVDGTKDFVSCGPGSDRAKANPGDNVAEGCEKVIREGIRVD